MGGFLTTLPEGGSRIPPTRRLKAAAWHALQVVWYERADDIASGVSGLVTRAKGIAPLSPI
jgi:hypothetical protein